MAWLKTVVIDLVMVLVAFVAVFAAQEWAWWIIAVYTPLMLLLKIFAFAGGAFLSQVKGKGPTAPPVFFHVIYAIMVALMLYAGWWLLAAGWAGIWLLSFVAERRAIAPVARPAGGRR